jgi:dipeptidyl aminopeptidase/acylaminoacyl peptidase
MGSTSRSAIGAAVRYIQLYGNVAWLSNGRAWVEEFDFGLKRKRIWLVDTQQPRQAPRLLWDWLSMEDAYANPGTPLLTSGAGGSSTYRGIDEPVLRQTNDWVYLLGDGSSVQGDRPFLDRFNLSTHLTERLFRSDEHTYEQVIYVLDADAHRVLTRSESHFLPPNYYIRDLKTGKREAVTHLRSAVSELEKVKIEPISYQRSDGLKLSAQLYLPPGFQLGVRVPVIIWAYPWTYVDASAAGQVRGSANRFAWSDGLAYSRVFRLAATKGFAVLWDASMPVVGGLRANDTAADQLVSNAQAAIDKLVEMGVANRNQIAIAGHSYGALMVGVLLSRSNLFSAGIALDGVYNLTNDPLGFQQELRTLWEAPTAYDQLSALLHADRIRAPLLLIHGELDNNWAAPLEESQRLYYALSGLGRKARLVILPYEGHVPEARESPFRPE